MYLREVGKEGGDGDERTTNVSIGGAGKEGGDGEEGGEVGEDKPESGGTHQDPGRTVQ